MSNQRQTGSNAGMVRQRGLSEGLRPAILSARMPTRAVKPFVEEFLIAGDGGNDGSVPAVVAMLTEVNPLPGPEIQAAVGDGD